MRNQRMISTVIGVMLAGALTYAQAQWLNYPDARIPRTKDGKPNLSAPAPRLNGKPDVSGLWQAERRYACSRHGGPERPGLARRLRPPSQRIHAHHRTLSPPRLRPHGFGDHVQ